MDENPNRRRPRNAAPIIGSPLSDPGLSSLSTSPQSFFIERTQSLDELNHQSSLNMARSPSAMSEIEVILDDGTTQKRTVSLSTLPDEDEEEEEEDHHHHHHHHHQYGSNRQKRSRRNR